VVDLMAEAEIVPSKSAARRTIASGGAYLNNRKVTSEDAVPGPGDLLHGRFLILRVGKRTVGAIEVVRLKRNAERPSRPPEPLERPGASSPSHPRMR
jgi:hypothetical protein